MCVGSCSNAGRFSFECGKILFWTHFTFLSNACRRWANPSVFCPNVFALLLNAVGVLFERIWLLFERVWLLVQMRLASRLNAVDFLFERVQALVRTRSYAGKTRSNDKCAVPCVWRVMYKDKMSTLHEDFSVSYVAFTSVPSIRFWVHLLMPK